MNDVFVKQVTITLFYTALTIFLNLCEIAKVTYNLKRMEYNEETSGNRVKPPIVVIKIENDVFRFQPPKRVKLVFF